MIANRKTITDLIRTINQRTEYLVQQVGKLQEELISLKAENKVLQQNNQVTFERMKEYIKELEQIKNRYVNSNYNLK
jgi:regulator of replication initiation timing